MWSAIGGKSMVSSQMSTFSQNPRGGSDFPSGWFTRTVFTTMYLIGVVGDSDEMTSQVSLVVSKHNHFGRPNKPWIFKISHAVNALVGYKCCALGLQMLRLLNL